MAYIVMAKREGVEVTVVGYSTRELAESFISRHQGKQGMTLYIRECVR